MGKLTTILVLVALVVLLAIFVIGVEKTQKCYFFETQPLTVPLPEGQGISFEFDNVIVPETIEQYNGDLRGYWLTRVFLGKKEARKVAHCNVSR